MFKEFVKKHKYHILIILLILIIVIVPVSVILSKRKHKTPTHEGFALIENFDWTDDDRSTNPYPWMSNTVYKTVLTKGTDVKTSNYSKPVISTTGEESNPIINIGVIPTGYTYKIFRQVLGSTVPTTVDSKNDVDITSIVNVTNNPTDGTMIFIDTNNPWVPPVAKPIDTSAGNPFYIYINNYIPSLNCKGTFNRTAIWDFSSSGDDSSAVCKTSVYDSKMVQIVKPVYLKCVGWSVGVKTGVNKDKWVNANKLREGWMYIITSTKNVDSTTLFLDQRGPYRDNTTSSGYANRYNLDTKANIDGSNKIRAQFIINIDSATKKYVFASRYLPDWDNPLSVVTACWNSPFMYLAPRNPITSTGAIVYNNNQLWNVTTDNASFISGIKPEIPLVINSTNPVYYINLVESAVVRKVKQGCGTINANQKYYLALEMSKRYGLLSQSQPVPQWTYLSDNANLATPITVTYVRYDPQFNKHVYKFTFTSSVLSSDGKTSSTYFIGQESTGATVVGVYPDPSANMSEWFIEKSADGQFLISLVGSGTTTLQGQAWSFCRQSNNTTDTTAEPNSDLNGPWTGIKVSPYDPDPDVDNSYGMIWNFSQTISVVAATPTINTINPWSISNLNTY